MIKILLFPFTIFLISINANGQCTNPTSYGSATAPSSNTSVTISTCNFQGEYGTVTGVVAGETYQITNSCGGYITVRSSTYNGTLVGSGNAPYTFTAAVSGTHYVHFNTNAACGTASNCCTTAISCTSCAIPTPPANDLCANATPLPCGTTNLAGTTINSTNITNSTGCYMSNYGVWYTFTGDGDQTTIDVSGVSGFDIEVAIESGSCGSFTNLNCEDSGNPESYTFNTVNGTDYYVYVAYWTTGTSTGNFTISRTCTTVTPPPNDEPCAATPVLTNNDFSCANFASGTIEFASNSGANNCIGTEDDDVWFSFVATSTYHTVDLNNISGSVTDLVHAIYNGYCGALGAPIVCSDPNSSTITGLTIGSTYYVQVYTYTATTGQNTNFDICIGTPPPPPGNDDPCGSISLTVNPDYSCASTTSGTVASATNSGVNACGGTEDDDVWYHFVATGPSHTVDLINVAGSTTDLYHAVYGPFANVNPPNCTNATVGGSNISCSDPNSSTLTGLVTGQTYFVQVYSWTSTTGQTSTFDICIGTPPPPPSNDEPCGAIALTVNSTCIGTTGSVGSATNSGIDACFGTPDNDVWYSFVATNTSQTVSLFNVFGSTTDMYHAVYGSFTQPDCSVAVADNISCNDSDSTDLTGLTVGATYFVQVFTYFSGSATTTFEICVTEPCTLSGSIANTPTLCPTIIIDEQGNDPFAASPFISNPSANIDCSTDTVTLSANPNLKETTSYIVEQIIYPNPAPDYDFPILGGNQQVINTDDVWATSRTNIGFPFCFYDNTYTQTLVGANGMTTFDNSIVPGSSCGWSFNNNLPSTAGALFEQTIYGVYHDIDPSGLTGAPIKSRTIGTAPCRQFQVSWTDIPMFGDASRLYTGMIVLHEATNIIEVFIETKLIENGNVYPWNDGNAIVGIQGDITPLGPNNQYAVAPCRNGLDTNWETTNEAWRFTPNGADVTPSTVTWYQGSINASNVIASNPDNSVTVSTGGNYFAVASFNTCSGTINLTDEIVVNDNRKVWRGTVNTDWYTPANWSGNAIPTSSDCVIIPDLNTTNNNSPIVIGGPPTPPPPGLARSLRVMSNGYLELTSESNLIVTDNIYIEDAIAPYGKIIIRDDGNLIQINNSPPNNNVGNIQMQRNVNSLTNLNYVYWSSPVNGFNVTNVSPGTNNNLIWHWIPTVASNGIGHYGTWQNTTEVMLPGKGYIVRGISGTSPETTPALNTVEFTGIARNGIISHNITHGNYSGGDYPGAGNTMATELDDNWNLVGNPYPSSISATKFITQNASIISTDNPNPAITGTIYLWNHLNLPSNLVNDPFYGDYVYNYNPNNYIAFNNTGANPPGFNGNIASGQAFFVLMDHNASTTGSSVVFNNNMRYDDTDPLNPSPYANNEFFRVMQRPKPHANRNTIERHRIWLDLIAPNDHANSILVGYVENATNGEDRLYDGFDLSKTSIRFYSLINEDKMSIQGRSLPFDVSDTVPLGLVIPENGNYTIAINSIDGLFSNTNQDIFLEDTYLNIIHDLRNTPYSFNSNIGTFNNRFILRYTNNALNISEETLLNGLVISAPNNNFIKVSSELEQIKTISVFDVLGRILYQDMSVNQKELIINNPSFSNGTYIVKASLSNGLQKTQKIILK